MLSIALKNPDLLSEINKTDLPLLLNDTPRLNATTTKDINEVVDIFLYVLTHCAPKGIRYIDLQHALLSVIFENDGFDLKSFKKKLNGFIFAPSQLLKGYKIQIADLYNKKKKSDKTKITIE